MEPKAALLVALASAGLAIGIVAVDMQFDTTYHVETMRDGEWVSLSERGPAVPKMHEAGYSGCGAQDLRLAIHHDGPTAKSFEVSISYYDNAQNREVMLVDANVKVAAGATERIEFRVPDDAFSYDSTQDIATVPVNIMAGAEYLYACAERGRTD